MNLLILIPLTFILIYHLFIKKQEKEHRSNNFSPEEAGYDYLENLPEEEQLGTKYDSVEYEVDIENGMYRWKCHRKEFRIDCSDGKSFATYDNLGNITSQSNSI